MATTQTVAPEIVESFEELLKRDYKEDIAELAKVYPDQTSLRVDYRDIERYDTNLADDLIQPRGDTSPTIILDAISDAIENIDLPFDIDLADVEARVYNLPETRTIYPEELRSGHGGQYVSVTGTLDRATSTDDKPQTVVWRCNSHHHPTETTHSGTELTPPPSCDMCESGRSSFHVDEQATEWVDACRIKVKTPPEVAEQTDGNSITGLVEGDLVEYGGEQGLIGRAGDKVTISGIIKREQKEDNSPYFDRYMNVHAIEFEKEDGSVDMAEQKPVFEDLAEREDAVDLFAGSIAPQLHTTGAWDAAFEFAVAYLFGAPRIDIPEGPTYRGDLHFLILSDYAMGKSTFKEEIESYSPHAVSKSTTALSSDVGLTAAAVKDDFGEGQWTVQPGLLVRANGGHLILDEIDKGPEELTGMNDAIEGEQVVDVEKAGQSVTYDSKSGLLALGNPVDGRFNANEAIAPQLGIDDTLVSRFDGIVTMEDTVDTEQDRKVARTYGKAYTEAQQLEYGDREEVDTLDRDVPVDTGRAWIQYARENVHPILEYDQFEEIEDWYAEEARQLNEKFAANSGETDDMPAPTTIRDVAAVTKMAIAFARCRLQDKVESEQVERAKKLGKTLIKQNWDGERFDAGKNVNTREIEGLRGKLLESMDRDIWQYPNQIAVEVGEDEDKVRNKLEEKLVPDGDAEEKNGKYRLL